VSRVTTFTTVPNFQKGRVHILVVIFWCSSRERPISVLLIRERAKRLHQVCINEHSLHNSLNFLKVDGSLGGDILVLLQEATSFTKGQNR
jgi:hypothetical protein